MSSSAVSAVIDTNLVLSGFLSVRGTPGVLLDAFHASAFRPILSPSLRAEYADVLARPRFALDPEEVAAFFRFLDRRALVVHPGAPTPVPVRDPKDAQVLATALAGRADYLVTGDADLLVLAGDPRLGALQIVTARVFLDALPGDPRP